MSVSMLPDIQVSSAVRLKAAATYCHLHGYQEFEQVQVGVDDQGDPIYEQRRKSAWRDWTDTAGMWAFVKAHQIQTLRTHWAQMLIEENTPASQQYEDEIAED